MFGCVVLAGQFQLGLADRAEALGHLHHVPFEQPHRHGGAVLEQVRGPGERIGIVGEGRAPHRGTTGGVDDTHVGAAALARAFDVAPLEVVQLIQQVGGPAQPLLIHHGFFVRRIEGVAQIG